MKSTLRNPMPYLTAFFLKKQILIQFKCTVGLYFSKPLISKGSKDN